MIDSVAGMSLFQNNLLKLITKLMKANHVKPSKLLEIYGISQLSKLSRNIFH